jgi:hypothetical protein
VLLIIVGILLAFTLFAAGVLWYSRAESKTFHPEPSWRVAQPFAFFCKGWVRRSHAAPWHVAGADRVDARVSVPPLTKNVKDGAPQEFQSLLAERVGKRGHPALLRNPGLRKGRERLGHPPCQHIAQSTTKPVLLRDPDKSQTAFCGRARSVLPDRNLASPLKRKERRSALAYTTRPIVPTLDCRSVIFHLYFIQFGVSLTEALPV